MAKKASAEKTNVMRVLEQHKIPYTPHEYPHGKEAVDGASVAHLLGQDPAQANAQYHVDPATPRGNA